MAVGCIILSVSGSCKQVWFIDHPTPWEKILLCACTFCPSLCIINDPAVVIDLCWERSLWDPEFPDSQILLWPASLPGMCHSAVNGEGRCFSLLLTVWTSAHLNENGRQTYTNRSMFPAVRGTVTHKRTRGSVSGPCESRRVPCLPAARCAAHSSLCRGTDRWGDTGPLWDFGSPPLSLENHSALTMERGSNVSVWKHGRLIHSPLKRAGPYVN